MGQIPAQPPYPRGTVFTFEKSLTIKKKLWFLTVPWNPSYVVTLINYSLEEVIEIAEEYNHKKLRITQYTTSKRYVAKPLTIADYKSLMRLTPKLAAVATVNAKIIMENKADAVMLKLGISED